MAFEAEFVARFLGLADDTMKDGGKLTRVLLNDGADVLTVYGNRESAESVDALRDAAPGTVVRARVQLRAEGNRTKVRLLSIQPEKVPVPSRG